MTTTILTLSGPNDTPPGPIVTLSSLRNAIDVSLGELQGQLNGDIYCESLIVSTVEAVTTQGGYLQWNRNGGDGGTWLINQRGEGSGGINFGEATSNNVFTPTLTISSTGNVTASGTVAMASLPPASSTAAGKAGTITWDAQYLYICTSTSPATWRRIAHSAF